MREVFFSALPVVGLILPLFTSASLLAPFDTASATVNAATTAMAQQAEPEMSSSVHERILAAKRLLTTHPVLATNVVKIAAEEPLTKRVHLLSVAKEIFLKKRGEAVLTTSHGSPVRLRIVRANGVNTAVTIEDEAGVAFVPLAVKYPIGRSGAGSEVAYYTSVHPAIESTELARDGRAYVRRMLDAAASRLAQKGISIEPGLLEVAERLCIVEHTDHERFRTEDHLALFKEISSLYALNTQDTYRYSVSSAGAGGMIQMIPRTYRKVKARHPEADLEPDFVTGMQDHSNALEAMLLYMQDTWDDLTCEEEVRQALTAQLATPAELLAAGYNSNPDRLAGYLARGGTEWRTLIPLETQMYLRIYAAVDSLVPLSA